MYKKAADISEADRLRAQELEQRLKELLQIALPKDPATNNAEMAEIGKIRKELNDLGFMVTWEATATVEDLTADPPRVTVTVNLWTLRDNIDQN